MRRFCESLSSFWYSRTIASCRLAVWLRWAAFGYVIYAVVANIQRWPGTLGTALGFFLQAPQFVSFAPWIALVITSLNIAIAVAVFFFPLRALAQILEILMELEFNSRAAK